MQNDHYLSAVKEYPPETTSSSNLSQQGRTLTLLCSCVGFAIIILDANIVTVALPRISHDLGGGSQMLLWFVNIYPLIFASLLLTGGTLGDRLGTKPVFLVGLLLFILSSLAGSLAPRMEVLILTRAFQGLGAALLTPASLALITHTYTDKQERTRAIGIYSAISGIGFIAGPLLGGLLIDTFGWRCVFLLSVPIGIATLALAARYVTAISRSPEGRFDLPGQVLAICTLVSLTYILIEGKQLGWRTMPILVGTALFVSSAVLFVLVESRSKEPMLPLQLFTSLTFSVANIIAYFYNFGLYGLLLVLTLFLQNVQRISATKTGLQFLPLSLTFLLTTWLIAGRLTARHGPRLSLVLGATGGCLGALMIEWSTNNSNPILLVTGLIAFGFGIGMIMPAMTVAVLSSVKVTQAGIGSAVLNTSRQVGGVIGPVLAGTLVSTASFRTGMQSALLMISGGFLLCFVLSLLFISPNHSVEKR